MLDCCRSLLKTDLGFRRNGQPTTWRVGGLFAPGTDACGL
jgi:hypothetical protein